MRSDIRRKCMEATRNGRGSPVMSQATLDEKVECVPVLLLVLLLGPPPSLLVLPASSDADSAREPPSRGDPVLADR